VSDFDTVLERLLTDPGFTAALAADPASALRGYRLSEDELELLYAQVSTDTGGGQRQVEQRTSKASLFGLLSPMVGGHDSGIGHAVGSAGGAHAGFAEAGAGNTSRFGPAGGGGGPLGIDHAVNSIVEPGQGDSGQGIVIDDPGTGSGSGPLGHGIGDLPGHGAMGEAPTTAPVGYHPHIDADGDGRWDQYTVRGSSDGGVDVVADMDHDGRPDFVGHDGNADGIIDSADYDKNQDGVFETHMTDTNGDGWLDQTRVDPR
jgi:hypothetical protein